MVNLIKDLSALKILEKVAAIKLTQRNLKY